jgi:hypothetical protein
MNNADMPASPLVNSEGFPCHESKICFENGLQTIGLTKREAFAMVAMQGLMSNHNLIGTIEECSSVAVAQADALLKELDK